MDEGMVIGERVFSVTGNDVHTAGVNAVDRILQKIDLSDDKW